MRRRAESRPTRRTVMSCAALGAVGVAGLAGCAAESEDEAPWTALGTTPLQVWVSDLEVDQLPPAPVVETPQYSYTVAAASLFSSFTQEEVESLFRMSFGPHEGITAAEGTVFLLSVLRKQYLEDLRWSVEARVEVRTRIRFTDGAGRASSLELDPEQRQEQWLLQVPADPSPEDAVLEIDLAGRIRRLSLVDGSLVHDDLAYLEGRRRGLVVRTGTAEGEWLFQAEQVDEYGASDAVGLQPGDGILLPVSTAVGWPAPGTLLAGVTVHHHQYFTPAEAQRTGRGREARMPLPTRLEGCTLALPDGAEVPQTALETVVGGGMRDGAFDVGIDRIWFEVPVGVETATLRLRLTLCPRRDGLAEILGLEAGVEAALELTEEPQL